MLSELIGCSVFMLEYRGYGLSTGSPDEKGLMIDAQTGLDYLTNRQETKNNQIVVYGQSLGGAVSIALVANNQKGGKISGLVLENTFLSMRKLIPSYVLTVFTIITNGVLTERSVIPPARYLSYLCHQIWPSDAVIPQITEVPVLFLSGLRDEIVPYVFTISLFTFPHAQCMLENDDLTFHPQNMSPSGPGFKRMSYDTSDLPLKSSLIIPSHRIFATNANSLKA